MKRLVYKEIAQCLNGYGKVPQDIQDKRDSILAYLEKNILLSGSGFDNGCTIIREAFNEKITIIFEYHNMGAMGGYCGWTNYKVIVKPSLLFDLDIRIVGPDKAGNKDYFYDVFGDILMRELSEYDTNFIASIYKKATK